MLAQAYQELKKKHEQEITDFPIAWAFSDDQLQEALKKLDADISEVCTYMQLGDVLRKKDVPAFKELLKRQAKELRDLLLSSKDIAYEMFLYEMDNHEYAINWDGDGDVLGCFDLNVEDLDKFDLRDVYLLARRAHMKHAQEWDMI